MKDSQTLAHRLLHIHGKTSAGDFISCLPDNGGKCIIPRDNPRQFRKVKSNFPYRLLAISEALAVRQGDWASLFSGTFTKGRGGQWGED